MVTFRQIDKSLSIFDTNTGIEEIFTTVDTEQYGTVQTKDCGSGTEVLDGSDFEFGFRPLKTKACTVHAHPLTQSGQTMS
jgi:hypothetical protein